VSDLHEQLLAELDHARRARGRDEMVAALRAVVKRHAPIISLITGAIVGCQDNYGEPWPCSTIQVIARELGVDGA
jgi:hypothetical protein